MHRCLTIKRQPGRGICREIEPELSLGTGVRRRYRQVITPQSPAVLGDLPVSGHVAFFNRQRGLEYITVRQLIILQRQYRFACVERPGHCRIEFVNFRQQRPLFQPELF